MPKTAFYQHAHCQRHDMGDTHPESPARVQAIVDRLQQSSWWSQLVSREAPLAVNRDLQRIHLDSYIDQFYRLQPKHGLVQADEDTLMGPFTQEAALRAAGAGVDAVNAILMGEFDRAFCAVRPPGHHAEPAVTMGFCFFNNIAIAAAHALSQEGINKVAIIDFDVHQCNGTLEAFAMRPQVHVFSSFQHPFYPNSHWNAEHPHIHLTPLVAYSDFRDVETAWLSEWQPALEELSPDFMFISAGFDAHTLDPLGQLNWQTQDYRWLTERICEQANASCQGRIVSMLEGGYHLDALADSAVAHISALVEV